MSLALFTSAGISLGFYIVAFGLLKRRVLMRRNRRIRAQVFRHLSTGSPEALVVRPGHWRLCCLLSAACWCLLCSRGLRTSGGSAASGATVAG
jgi:hypothetical protein